MNEVISEIIKETLSKMESDLNAKKLKHITHYETEANNKLPEHIKGKIRFKIGLLNNKLSMGYQEVTKSGE